MILPNSAPADDAHTPYQLSQGGIWVKRDDMFKFAGCYGNKVRGLLALLRTQVRDPGGLVTGVGRASAQMQLVARVGAAVGLRVLVVCPTGEYTPEMLDAAAHGAEMMQIKAGYTNVLKARAAKLASDRGWLCVPHGMGCRPAVQAIAKSITRYNDDFPVQEVKRVVVCLGSGTNVAAIARGIGEMGLDTPILGVKVGGRPTCLEQFGPPMWSSRIATVVSEHKYETPVHQEIRCQGDNGPETVVLDPYYEAKAWEFCQPGDLFWNIGRRVMLRGPHAVR